MRVAVIALLQESNTFLSESTTIQQFEEDVLLVGEPVQQHFADAHHEIGGFFAGLDEARIEAVPIFAARALPFGTISAETYDHLIDTMFEALQQAGPFDGVLAAAHGATVSENHPDVDGHWLARLRAHMGSGVPIISTIDPHANVSPAMIEVCDATIAYRTNPHIDQRQRGVEAARLMARTLRGEIRPTQAATFPPIAIDIEQQNTAEPPCSDILNLADRMLQQPKVLSNSLGLGFPYADVMEMGSSTIVVTDGDQDLAQSLSDQLAAQIWDRRHDCVGKHLDVHEALDRARQLDGAVCLLDMGDNVGGGSPGDETRLAHAIHDQKCADAFVCLCDPESVQVAERAGPGAQVFLRVGGKSSASSDPPLEASFHVVNLFDGRFTEPNPRHGGFTDFDQGPTAVVRTDEGLTVMLTSRRMVPFSLEQLRAAGVDPASFRLIVAKGVQAPCAAYESVCQHFIRVNTPGVTCADMQQLSYHHRRRPMFPFEPETTWTPDTSATAS